MATDDLIGSSNAGEPGAGGVSPDENAVVTLSIPCAPEYVGTARLTILGVASRMGFSYDQIEDIRLAVGEACANAIERSGGGRNGSAPAAPAHEPGTITIRSHVEGAKLTVEVEDRASAEAEEANVERPAVEIDGMNSHELGALLMEILVDEVAVEPLSGGGSRVRLIKYAGGS